MNGSYAARHPGTHAEPVTGTIGAARKRVHRRILYASKYGRPVDEDRMGSIVRQIVEAHAVTGTLHFDGRELRLSLEGPPKVIDALCERIWVDRKPEPSPETIEAAWEGKRRKTAEFEIEQFLREHAVPPPGSDRS